MKNSEVLDLSVTVYPEESAESFAFDACDAVYLLACEWGEYNVITFLTEELEYKPSPILGYETLTDEGREIYHMLDDEMRQEAQRVQERASAELGDWLQEAYRAQN